jgi:hypothetical protein
MLSGDGERVESSDDDGDDEDDDDDEFEDSEPAETAATEAESLTSEGELSATPDRAAHATEKWVAVKGQAQEPPSSPPPPQSPLQMLPGAVAGAVPALSR